MRPLRFDDGDVGWIFSSVKAYWEEDVRNVVIFPVDSVSVCVYNLTALDMAVSSGEVSSLLVAWPWLRTGEN